MKKLSAIILVLLVIAGSLGGLYYFTIYIPAQEKKAVEQFFGGVSKFEPSVEQVGDLNMAIAETQGEGFTAISNDVEVDNFATNMSQLLTELEDAEVPEEIQPKVDLLISDLKAISDSAAEFEVLYKYLINFSATFNKFTTSVDSFTASLGAMNSDDPNVVLTQFEIVRADFDAIYGELLNSLEQMEVPEKAKNFHTTVLELFNELYTEVSTSFDDLVNILQFTSRVVNSPNSLTPAEIQRAQNLNSELAAIQTRMESLSRFEAEFTPEKAEQLLSEFKLTDDFEARLLNIEKNLNELENYRIEKLNN